MAKMIKHPGMGAIPGAKGTTFRVWAPHAEKVYVTGTFDDWNKTSTPLTLRFRHTAANRSTVSGNFATKQIN